ATRRNPELNPHPADVLDVGRHPRLHRPRTRDLDRALEGGALLDTTAVRLEIQSRPGIRITTEVHELPSRLSDSLLTVNVSRDVWKPGDITRVQLARFDDVQLRVPRLTPVVQSPPQDMSVAPAHHTEHAPRVVVVDGCRRLGRKTAQHQRRSRRPMAENRGLCARLMERLEFGFVDQGSIGRQHAKKIAQARERRGGRAEISDKPLRGIEESLKAGDGLHAAHYRSAAVLN